MDVLVICGLIYAYAFFLSHLYRLCFRFILPALAVLPLSLSLLLPFSIPRYFFPALICAIESPRQMLIRTRSSVLFLFYCYWLMMCNINVFETDMVSSTTELFIFIYIHFCIGQTNK